MRGNVDDDFGVGADFDDSVVDDDDCVIVGGKRKGNAPEGEA